jgi:solute carrier family 25 protein 33/36
MASSYLLLALIFLLCLALQSSSASKSSPKIANPQLYNLLAGGIAGSLSSIITSPLEVVKTQLQSSAANQGRSSPFAIARDILQTSGPAGFWRGLPPTLVGIFPSRATYFYTYEASKKLLKSRESSSPILKKGGSTLNAILSGLAAGVVSNTVTNPIWMVKTRMQLRDKASPYVSYTAAIQTINAQEGVRGFYKGISASYWGSAEGCVQFVIYEKLKTALIERKKNVKRVNEQQAASLALTKVEYLCSAALSKAVASILTYPHEVARTRMREHATQFSGGMWNTLSLISAQEGRKGLYAGMGTHLARVVPNSAIMFLCYETLGSWLMRRFENRERGRGGA